MAKVAKMQDVREDLNMSPAKDMLTYEGTRVYSM
jgi:hypothetical protein